MAGRRVDQTRISADRFPMGRSFRRSGVPRRLRGRVPPLRLPVRELELELGCVGSPGRQLQQEVKVIEPHLRYVDGRSDGTAFDIELSGHQRFGKLRFHDEAKQWIQPTVPRYFNCPCRVAIDRP